MGDYAVGDLIEVTWIDIEQDTDYHDAERKRTTRTKFKTPGYYAGEDEDYLYFRYCVGVGGNDDYEGWSIPKGCVKEIVNYGKDKTE